MAEFITSADIPSFSTGGAENGWAQLPNGIVIEWGTVSAPSRSGLVNITLPKALTTIYNAVVCVEHPADEGAYVTYIRSIARTQIQCYKYGSKANKIHFFAVGKA